MSSPVTRNSTRGIKYTILNELIPLAYSTRPKAVWDRFRGTNKENIVYHIQWVLVVAFIGKLQEIK